MGNGLRKGEKKERMESLTRNWRWGIKGEVRIKKLDSHRKVGGIIYCQ